MINNRTNLALVSSALVLFLGLTSFVYAISVQNDFDFGGTYRIQNASTTTILGGLSVGTTTPQSAGTLYVGTTLKFGDGTSQTTAGATSVSAGQVSSGIFGSIAGKGNYTFQAAANSNTVLFVDASNERVGIGTASPAVRFDVNGVASISGNVGLGTSTPAVKLHLFDGASGPIIQLSGLTTNYRGLTVRDTAGAEQWFYGPNSSNNFVVRRSGSTDNITVNATTGNVGIGTSTPASKLDVVGSARISNDAVTNATVVSASDSTEYGTSAGTYQVLKTFTLSVTGDRTVQSFHWFGEAYEGADAVGKMKLSPDSSCLRTLGSEHDLPSVATKFEVSLNDASLLQLGSSGNIVVYACGKNNGVTSSYVKSQYLNVLYAASGTTVITPTFVGDSDRTSGVMYLITTDAGTPASCPVGWTEAYLGLVNAAAGYFNDVRTCFASSPYDVLEMFKTTNNEPACPTGWTKAQWSSRNAAGAGYFDYVLTCYRPR